MAREDIHTEVHPTARGVKRHRVGKWQRFFSLEGVAGCACVVTDVATSRGDGGTWNGIAALFLTSAQTAVWRSYQSVTCLFLGGGARVSCLIGLSASVTRERRFHRTGGRNLTLSCGSWCFRLRMQGNFIRCSKVYALVSRHSVIPIVG